MISKTFLFIGFSFEDPNLDYILSQIRILVGESMRDHYCFFEKVKQKEEERQEEYLYNQAKQDLRIRDLRRYGIQAVLLDSYSDINAILKEIEKGCLLKNIFVSGSLAKCDDSWTDETVISFIHCLGQRLVQENYQIISGFGHGVGSAIINGALEEIMRSKYKHIDEHLCLRPFPQIISNSISQEFLWQKYREDMIKQAGIVIFIFGNKKKDDNIIIADGMLKEFEIAKKLRKIIIPIGSTGGLRLRFMMKYLKMRKNILI